MAVKRVVEADLAQHKLALREDFTIESFMKESGLEKRISNRVSIAPLQLFGTTLAEVSRVNLESTSGAFQEFLEQLLFTIRTKERMDLFYEQEQVVSAIDELKL